MRRKAFATLCAAVTMVSAVSAAAPQTVKAAPAPIASYDFEDGFGDMTAAANGETAAPSIVTDETKGSVVKLEFGANGAESYTTFANPYTGKELSAATMTAWVNVPADAAFWEYDCLIGFTDGTQRLTLEAMPYVCWNAGADDNWIDAKAPAVFGSRLGTWVNYAVVITAEGQQIFVNGEQVTPEVANGAGYDAASVLPFLSAESTQAYLGFGSFWGSQGAYLDDVTFYDTALTAEEIKEVCNIDAVLATQPEVVPEPTPEPVVYDVVDLSTVTAAVPEGYSSYYAFDGNLTDAVTGQSGNTVGYMVHLEADSEEASYETGVKGQAVAFYGFGDAVKLPTAPKGSQYTISIDLFIKKTSQYTPAVFLANFYEDGSIKGGDEDAQWLSMAPLGWQSEQANGPMVWSRNVPGEAAWNDLWREGNNLLVTEKWFNLTLVADGANGTLYVDGSIVNEGPVADIVNETTQMYLGVNAWDTVFNGNMDNLYIYDRCLSADEVASLAKDSLTVVEVAPTDVPAEPTDAPAEPTDAPVATEAAANDTPAPAADSESESNTGLIVGIVVAVVVVAAVVVVVLKKKKK